MPPRGGGPFSSRFESIGSGSPPASRVTRPPRPSLRKGEGKALPSSSSKTRPVAVHGCRKAPNKVMIPKNLTGHNGGCSVGENALTSRLRVPAPPGRTVGDLAGGLRTLWERPRKSTPCRPVIDGFSPVGRARRSTAAEGVGEPGSGGTDTDALDDDAGGYEGSVGGVIAPGPQGGPGSRRDREVDSREWSGRGVHCGGPGPGAGAGAVRSARPVPGPPFIRPLRFIDT
jgi:hypothetical protein